MRLVETHATRRDFDAELQAIHERLAEPRWHSWVIMWLCWPLAALCALGLMIAGIG